MKSFEGGLENNTEPEAKTNKDTEIFPHNTEAVPFIPDKEDDLSGYIEKFPRGLDRKDTLEKNKKHIGIFKKHGKRLLEDESFYTWTDSPLELEGTNQEPIRSAFINVIPTEDKSIKNYIEESLKEKSGKAIGIEFGGIGSAAFSEFTPGFFKQSLAITLVDHRKKSLFKKLNNRSPEKRTNHDVMEADILDDETYSIVNEKLNGAKVDLIIERMARGLDFIPPEPYLAMKILQRWYDMLAEGGVMFVQTPVIFNELLVRWEKLIKETYPREVLELDCQYGMENKVKRNCSSIRIRKLEGAPTELPVLDHHTIARIGMSKDSIEKRRYETKHNDRIFKEYI